VPPGSLYIESYQPSQLVAVCSTFGRSATAMFKAASRTSWADPLVRSSVASCRPSGARPTIDCTYLDEASSIGTRPAVGGRRASLVMKTDRYFDNACDSSIRRKWRPDSTANVSMRASVSSVARMRRRSTSTSRGVCAGL
jgi:hypothetical protein